MPENMGQDGDLEIKDTNNNVEESSDKAKAEVKTFTQEDIDRIVKQEKARVERKYRRDEESKLSKAKQLEDTLRSALELNDDDDVLSKVKDFYKEQGVSIPNDYEISSKDAKILGQADANDLINDYEDTEIEARANELAVKQKQGKTTAREDAEFYKLGEYLTTKLEEKNLKENGIDISILKDEKFKKFAGRFNKNTKMAEIYELYQKLNGTEPQKPKSTGSVKSSAADKQEKEYYTQEDVDKLTDADYDNPTIMARVRKSMTKWKK